MDCACCWCGAERNAVLGERKIWSRAKEQSTGTHLSASLFRHVEDSFIVVVGKVKEKIGTTLYRSVWKKHKAAIGSKSTRKV